MLNISALSDKKESILMAASGSFGSGGARNIWLEDGRLLLRVERVDFPNPMIKLEDPRTIRLEFWEKTAIGPVCSIVDNTTFDWDVGVGYIQDTIWEKFCIKVRDLYARTLSRRLASQLNIHSVKDYVRHFQEIDLLKENELIITDRGFDIHYEIEGELHYFFSAATQGVRSVKFTHAEGSETVKTPATGSIIMHKLVAAVHEMLKYKIMHETTELNICFYE